MQKLDRATGRSSLAVVAGATGAPVAARGALPDHAVDDLGVSFYSATDVPSTEVSVREFEELTCNRLKVLHAFDRLCGYDTPLTFIPELRPKVQTELNNARLVLVPPMPADREKFPELKDDFVRRDCISHFALRLAFCKTRDAREWFLRQEQRLFVLRFDALRLEAQEAFLKKVGLECKPFAGSAAELEELQKSTAGAKIWGGGEGAGARGPMQYEKVFYEMPFQEVHPQLIAARKVVLKRGVAYIPSSALKLILAARFKERLIEGLDVAFQGLPAALGEPRVGGFLRVLQDHGMQLLVAARSSSEEPCERLSLANFEELLVRSFPPCMRRIVEAQREQGKHLKHAGRLQLRPFLKDCGFTMEESFKWWQQELTRDREIDVISFEKNYLYDLEHAYGKKGHFQGQHCFGCPKIIGLPHEATGQVHGCLFKLEMPALKQQLHKWHVSDATMGEIEKLVSNGKHYQLACIEYFRCKHPGHEGDGVGNTPADFFRESCRHFLAKEGGKAAAPEKKAPSAGVGAAVVQATGTNA